MTSKTLWIGRVTSGLPVLFMLFDASIKLLNIAPVRAAHERLGYDPKIAPILGAVELACTVLYVVPRTSFLGALLLTGYLGGAIAAHVRLGEPFFFALLVGMFFWAGLFLRDKRLRALVPGADRLETASEGPSA